MVNFTNAAPYANLLGINDVSGRPPVIDPEAIPTHLPHVWFYARKGRTLPQLSSGDSLITAYGSETFNPRSKYYNHQTILVNALQGQGNAVMSQRILPDDVGPKSRLLFSIEIVSDNIEQFERAPDGTFLLDENGEKIPDGLPIPGFKARWIANSWTAGPSTIEPFGAVTTKAGGLLSSSSFQSTRYPIFELEVDSEGEWGNNVGARLSAPTSSSAVPMDVSVAEAIKAYLFRIQLISRTDPTVTPTVVETTQGEQYIDFAFKQDAIDLKSDRDVGVDALLIQSYQDIDTPGNPPQYGPFGRMHVYRTNLELVLSMIAEREVVHGTLPFEEFVEDSEYLYTVNPLTAKSFDGVPYYSFEMVGPAGGGLLFSENSNHYAAGGSDGTMTLEAFDASVRTQCLGYGELEANLLDWAVYPHSVFYDTGFTLETKKAMLTPIGRRKDVWTVLSTQDVLEPQNTGAEETSIATALRTHARNFPESEIYGTGVVRAIVIGQSGYMINEPYKGLTTNVIEFAEKCARYMSAGSGIWRNGLGFDSHPNNILTKLRGVNATFKPASARRADWEVGLVWAQNYDRRSLFWPAVQTVYDDDTSILNGAINMMIAVDLQKVALRSWRDLTGVSNLTDDQFIERSNKLIEDDVKNKYDGRVTIQADTYFTQRDEQLGYRWSTKIRMYGANMKTVGTFTVESHRNSDLTQGG